MIPFSSLPIHNHILFIVFPQVSMHNKMNALSLSCVMVLAILAHTTLAQNNPQDYVNTHNTARAAVGVSNVSWNTTLQAYAQTYANSRMNDCSLIHSGGTYGENLFWGSATTYTGVDAVNAWVSEQQYYHYTTNTCDTGKVCGHYTQVVWSSSTQIGCARVVCNNNAGVFIICSYSPRGNCVGQKPY